MSTSLLFSATSLQFKKVSEHVQLFVRAKEDADMIYIKFLATNTNKFHACWLCSICLLLNSGKLKIWLTSATSVPNAEVWVRSLRCNHISCHTHGTHLVVDKLCTPPISSQNHIDGREGKLGRASWVGSLHIVRLYCDNSYIGTWDSKDRSILARLTRVPDSSSLTSPGHRHTS